MLASDEGERGPGVWGKEGGANYRLFCSPRPPPPRWLVLKKKGRKEDKRKDGREGGRKMRWAGMGR